MEFVPLFKYPDWYPTDIEFWFCPVNPAELPIEIEFVPWLFEPALKPTEIAPNDWFNCPVKLEPIDTAFWPCPENPA